MYQKRLLRLMDLINNAGFAGAVFNPGANLVYLTGLHFHLSERPTTLLINAQGEMGLVLPLLERIKLDDAPCPVQAFPFGDDPATWGSVFKQAAMAMGMADGKIATEPARLRMLELRFLEQAAPHAHFEDAANLLMALRLQKDAEEIALMRQAAQIAEQALLETLKNVQVGMSERQIAAELTIQLLKAGSDTELPFQPIVSTGLNSANPHATPTERLLQPGDLLLIDFGAAKDGYFSDITRTFYAGHLDDTFKHIAEVVKQANLSGRNAGKPGVDAGLLDRAARFVIEKASYGSYFTHRLGHGLGMESHEPPYLFAENDLVMQPGMTYTVEPGIYLPSKGGIRIEDDMLITANGAEALTNLPRDVLPIEQFHLPHA